MRMYGDFSCSKCGQNQPCTTLGALHIVTAHGGGDLATTAIVDEVCQRCLLQSLELYIVRVTEGKLQRVAIIGKTEALVPY